MQTGFRKAAETLDRFSARNRKEFIENEFPSYSPLSTSRPVFSA